MHIISDQKQLKALTKRGQKRTVIEELVRQGFRPDIDFRIAHDGWPVLYLRDVDTGPSGGRPNFEALDAA